MSYPAPASYISQMTHPSRATSKIANAGDKDAFDVWMCRRVVVINDCGGFAHQIFGGVLMFVPFSVGSWALFVHGRLRRPFFSL